jgi:hypothetical protein
MAHAQRWWRICFVLGLVAIGTVGWFASRQVPDCGVPMDAPMIVFELATSKAELAQVLDCRPRLQELDHQNIVDLGLFIWAYAGFLMAFALAAGVRPWLVFTLTAGIIIGDLVETTGLRSISAAWPGFDPTALMPLMVSARLKFILLGALMIEGGWRLAQLGQRVTGGIIAVGGIGCIAVLFDAGRIASALTAAAWLVILGLALVRGFRRPAPASPGA